MCPLYPVHLVLMYGAVLVCVWVAGLGSVVTAAAEVATLKVRLQLSNNNDSTNNILSVKEGEVKQVTFYIDDLPPQAVGDILIKDESDDKLNHLKIAPNKIPLSPALTENMENGSVEGSFNITGNFLGFTKIKLVLSDGKDDELLVSKPVDVSVQRGQRVMDKIFIHVVIAMVIVAYINMGCAIDLKVIKQTLCRPVAPAIGLFSQYLFMPLISYAIGYGLFYDTPAMWLGLFLTGCSPGGGGSNMWTYLLGGSLDLSVTMTFISTVGAFAALPLWVYALASTIFKEGHFSQLPYKNIAMLVVGLVLPLSIGLLIQWKSQKVAVVLKRLLKPVSIIFIIVMMTFGVYANFYIFSFFDWKVALQEFAPLGDVTMVIPIAVATMTPIPLTIAYIIKRIREYRKQSFSKDVEFPFDDEEARNGHLSSSNSATPLHKDANGNSKMVVA
ncbi:Solute carrier family 10 member 6-like 3 [Homarus americanus]|uniref:Solute carrier family 10 member 6-like 3 n=1 Tax=Homarus americanus TaxID=6706 RepID=A0A8J5N190_HOMAM|nr:Solute carrier family 10 member 6-like 3 [Homarus americanus]